MASFAAAAATAAAAAALYHASNPFSSFVFVSLHCSSVFTVSANFNEEHTARGGAPLAAVVFALSGPVSLAHFISGGRQDDAAFAFLLA